MYSVYAVPYKYMEQYYVIMRAMRLWIYITYIILKMNHFFYFCFFCCCCCCVWSAQFRCCWCWSAAAVAAVVIAATASCCCYCCCCSISPFLWFLDNNTRCCSIGIKLFRTPSKSTSAGLSESLVKTMMKKNDMTLKMHSRSLTYFVYELNKKKKC